MLSTRWFGLKLLVAFCDGRVVVLEPERPFLPNVWNVEGTLLVPGGLEVIGASWRSSLPGNVLGDLVQKCKTPHIDCTSPVKSCYLGARD